MCVSDAYFRAKGTYFGATCSNKEWSVIYCELEAALCKDLGAS